MQATHIHTLPRIAITLGDPNGIGPELLVEVLQEAAVLEQLQPILYGSAVHSENHR